MLSLFTISSGRLEAVPGADAWFVLSFRGMTVAVGAGELAGEELAPALFADVFALEAGSILTVDQPLAWGGVVWRLGGGARRFLVGEATWTADAAWQAGLCDVLAAGGEGASHAEWVREWIGSRDPIALESAAVLLRQRSGDVLERSEFGRLFAAGAPQAGLAAFLQRRRSRLGEPRTEG